MCFQLYAFDDVIKRQLHSPSADHPRTSSYTAPFLNSQTLSPPGTHYLFPSSQFHHKTSFHQSKLTPLRKLTLNSMGSCLSLSLTFDKPETPTATVISVNGELKDFPTPITALQVLTMFQTQIPTVDQTSSTVDFVLCNSDSLCYNEQIPSMNPNDILQTSQIYFLIPTSRLQYRLSATDMAALAVKASVAIQKRDGARKKARISPVPDTYLESNDRVQETVAPFLKKSTGVEKSGAASTGSYVRSGSIRKLQRYSSRRAKLAVRSFRLMLSTIYE